MLKKVFLDIETVPPAEEWRALITPAIIRKVLMPSGVDKAQSKQAETLETSCTDEQFRKLALHAEYGRVLSVAVIIEQDGEIAHRGVFGRERQTRTFHLDERRTLRGFWNLLRDFDTGHDIVIGHNIMDFDLPFLYKRSRINRVRPTIAFSFARYKSAPVYDTMREWAHWNPRGLHISLSDLAAILKIEPTKTDGINGSRVWDEYLAGNHELIAKYNLQDVEVVRAIYYRMVQPEIDQPVCRP